MFAQIVLGYCYASLNDNPCARRGELGKPYGNGVLSRITGVCFSIWGDELADWRGLFSETIGHLGKRLPKWKDVGTKPEISWQGRGD